MSGKIAFLFPGQGSQQPGMGKELHDAEPAAARAFEEMDEALDAPVSRLCFEGSAEELALTENTQPAILACSVAAWRCLAERGLRPDYVAGHSLGEYSALVAAGVLSAGDAVRTVRARGRYMQEATPVGQGAMAALLGLERDVVAQLCSEAAAEGEVLSPANFNAPGQVVVAGHREAVERVAEAAKERGARRAVLLSVSAPFHCSLMEPAAERLAADLAGLEYGSFGIPLVANVDARETEDSSRVAETLRRQVTSPVRWDDSVARMSELGVDTFVEVGPGKVLGGLVKRIARGSRILAAGTPEGVAAVAAALG